MTTYFLRRLLLMIPTFIGITLVAFTIIQFVPGGPLEQEMMKLRGAMAGGEAGAGASADKSGSTSIPAEALEEMKAYYGYDKPVLLNFHVWSPEARVATYMEALPLEENIRDEEIALTGMNEELKAVDGRAGVRDDEAMSGITARQQEARSRVEAMQKELDTKRSAVIATAELALPYLVPIALGEGQYSLLQQEPEPGLPRVSRRVEGVKG